MVAGVRGVPHDVPTGHLVYVELGKLMAVRFDLNRLEVLGAPVIVLDGVRQSRFGATDVGFSDRGGLVYVEATAVAA